MNRNAARWIRRLELKKHPEGGYYRETYRSAVMAPARSLPRRFRGARSLATVIYFLLPGREVSRLHRLRADEIWHYHAGSALTLHIISPSGNHRALKLGGDPGRGETPQAIMPAGCLFGAVVNQARSYTLVGCTVTPGFEFADFEAPGRRKLLAMHPRHAGIIRRLTP